jgi:N-acetylglucosaminyldiphosphoundecaprenol N-acetyl-beta-D-mannosaminyltransferase
VTHISTTDSELLNLYMMIKPEKEKGPFAVSLWATWTGKSGPRVMAAPESSWHDFSSRLENSGLLDSDSLGCVDAHVGRGEPTVRYVSCSLEDLQKIGLRDVPESEAKELRGEAGALYQKISGTHGSFSTDEYQPHASENSASKSQIALLGVRIDNISTEQSVSIIDSLIDQGGFHQIATANVDFLNKAAVDPELMEILHNCELVLPDGMPLVWASRLMGTPLKERVTGVDLVPRLLELSVQKKRRIFLLGATEDCSNFALERVCREYPGAVICGRMSPPTASLTQMKNSEILKRIEESKPDILLVAFGNPKQEKWLAMHRDQLKVPVCIGVGGALDLFSEKQMRAPIWMQRFGMEWMFRFVREPRRLGPRYLEGALFLLRYLSRQLLLTSVQPRKTETTKISIKRKENAVIVRVSGDFTGSAVVDLQHSLEPELENGCSFIMDLSSTSAIRPDAAGLLAFLAHRAGETNAQIWLVGVQRGVIGVLRATFPTGHYFRTAATLEEALCALQMNTHTFSSSLSPIFPITRPSETARWSKRQTLYQWE